MRRPSGRSAAAAFVKPKSSPRINSLALRIYIQTSTLRTHTHTARSHLWWCWWPTGYTHPAAGCTAAVLLMAFAWRCFGIWWNFACVNTGVADGTIEVVPLVHTSMDGTWHTLGRCDAACGSQKITFLLTEQKLSFLQFYLGNFWPATNANCCVLKFSVFCCCTSTTVSNQLLHTMHLMDPKVSFDQYFFR